MSTLAPELPAGGGETIADDLAGMGSFFVDPSGAARRVFHKWFWVGPLVLFSVVSLVVAYILAPMTLRVMESMGLNERQVQVAETMQHVTMWFAPVSAAVIYAIEALILFGVASVMSVSASFRSMFNLVAGCSLIQMLAAIAGVVIVKMRGEVATMADMRPALGIDIFLPEGTNKFLLAFVGYFSIFEIWWIVMMVLVLSRAFRISAGKAFAIVLPLVLVGVLFRVIVAAFGRGA